MPRPKPRYRVSLSNLETGKSLKIELVDLPFAGRRTFRLRGGRRVGAQGAGGE